MPLRSLALVLIALAACGDDPAVMDGGDAGTDAAPDTSEPDDGVADPAAPAPPLLTPCPEGTAETPREGAPTECWPVTEPACAEQEVRYLGETGCESVGAPCPIGDFPEDVPTGAVFVKAGTTGGDGSRGAPLGTVAAGVAAAGRGGTVIVGKGTYDEELTVRNQVSIIGACATETSLTSASASSVDAILNIAGGPVTLRDISFRDAPRGGVVVTGAGSTAHLEGVLIDSTSVFGVYVDQSAEATIDGLVVRDVATSTRDGRFGSGLVVDTSGQVTASRVVIAGTHSTAINALGQATATVERLTIRDILPDDRGLGGRALSIKDGAEVQVDGFFVQRTRDTALEARDADTVLTVTNGVVSDTQLHTDGERGRALTSIEGARAVLSRVVIDGFGDAGLLAGSGASVEARDVVIRDARAQEDGDFGRFVEALGGSSVEGARLWLEDAKDVGLSATGEGTRLVVFDLHLERLAGRVSDGALGRGVNAQFGASVELSRAAILDTRNVGIFVDAASAVLEDVEIHTITPAPGTRRGRGFSFQSGSVASCARARVVDAYDVGLFASFVGTDITVEDLSVRGIVAPPCGAGESCGLDPGGIGVGAYDGARCSVTRIAVSDAALCGVHVAANGELDLAGGRITDSTIGACVQVDGYDVTRLDSAEFADNGTSLEATMLPVPEPAPAVE